MTVLYKSSPYSSPAFAGDFFCIINERKNTMKQIKKVLQILCPYGRYFNGRFTQVVDRRACKLLKRSMPVFRPIPIYVRHPEKDWLRKYSAKPVGKVTDLIPVEGGMLVECTYPVKTYKKIRKYKLGLSPFWRMDKIGDGEYRPKKLISVGITDSPLIPSSGQFIKLNHQNK